MDAPRCPLCGDTRRLSPDGVCEWRGGCEHRQMVEGARMAQLDQFLIGRPVAGLTIDGVSMDVPTYQIDSLPALDPEGCPECAELAEALQSIPDELIDLAHRYMVDLTDEARARGLLGADEEFSFDLSDLLTYRRDDE